MAARIHVTLPAAAARTYEVLVGSDVLRAAAGEMSPAGWLLVVDDHVARLHGPTATQALQRGAVPVVTLAFPAGEASKTLATVGLLLDRALDSGAGRDWAVAALGGGVTGDLGGFVAATLFRGLPWLGLPTSLLAMVDSSVGGKTGIDTRAGKNLVGAFHQPHAVVADVATLQTLPESEMSCGLAEVIKYGAIGDAALLDELEAGLLEACLRREHEALIGVVTRCVRQKTAIVALDEREAGPREILNFGHTVAHALERLTDYRLAHGEAVAIGMIVEAELAARGHGGDSTLPQRLARLCSRAGLPTSLPEAVAVEDVLAVARRDKKARAGTIRCALPARAGLMIRPGAEPIREADLVAALAAWR